MHKMMGSMMLIGAAAVGPPAAPGDVVQTILPDVSADGDNWHRAYPDKSGVFVYNPSGDGADAYSMDLNGDGVEDFRIRGGVESVQMECAAGNAAWCEPPRGSISTLSWLLPLKTGDMVGETVTGLTENLGQWRNRNIFVSAYSVSLTVPPVLSASGNYYFGTTAYAGLRFQIGTNTHYGRVLIDEVNPSPGFFPLGAAFVVSFAYETEPDKPIPIPIPEPGSAVLLVVGAGLLLLHRRARRHPANQRFDQFRRR